MDLFSYPDLQRNWYKPAIRAGDELLANHDFDAIISSSKPVTSHLVANELKKRHNIPFIADLRDLWTQNHFYPYSRVRRFFDKRLEKKVLNNVNAITTVSEPLKNRLAMNYPADNIYVITYGFDPDESGPASELQSKFNITFTGTIYKGRNDIEKLFQALSEFIEEKKIHSNNISLDFYGKHTEKMIGRNVENYNLGSIININGLIPMKEAMSKQKSAQLLLLFDWTECKEKGIYTGKIFEYLAVKRPIMAVGLCKDVVNELLIETEDGVHLSTVEEIKKQINSYYDEYMANGRIEYRESSEKIEKYSQIRMAKKFADVLEIITKQ